MIWTGAIVVDDEMLEHVCWSFGLMICRLTVGSMALVADLEGGTVVGEGGLLGEDMAGCFV